MWIQKLSGLMGLVVLGALMLPGCARHTELLPHRDPHLRRPAAEFVADAAARHPYPRDLPNGGQAEARGQVAYMVNRLELVNLSDSDWWDVELWVNRHYVVHLPTMERGQLKQVNFHMMYDDQGRHFPTRGALVYTVELRKNGQMYEVPVRVAH